MNKNKIFVASFVTALSSVVYFGIYLPPKFAAIRLMRRTCTTVPA
jgi:hypothetical protein